MSQFRFKIGITGGWVTSSVSVRYEVNGESMVVYVVLLCTVVLFRCDAGAGLYAGLCPPCPAVDLAALYLFNTHTWSPLHLCALDQ